MLGKTPSDFTSETNRLHLQEERILRQEGLTSTYESVLVHKDAHEVPALVTGVPRRENNEIVGSIAVITDLTDRKKTEEALARQVKELTVLHAAAIAEAEGESEDEIISKVTEIVAQIYSELCGFLLLNEHGDKLTPHFSYIGASIPDWQNSFAITHGITGQAVTLDKI